MDLDLMRGVTLAVAEARSVQDVLALIVDGIAQCQNVALARIWLIKREADDRGERAWLQLAASAGNLTSPGSDARRLDGRFSRFEIGERKVGKVAAEGRGLHLPDLATECDWIAIPEWIAAESIASFAAQPLISRRETLGVLAVFDRARISDSDFAWLRTFADHGAVAIANARAFEEIEQLRRRLELDNDYLREEVTASFGDILGSSPSLQKVLRQVEMVAPTEATVLVLGESGVGKELVARALHQRSKRKDRPLIKVNCAAVPAELFESEFFGHARGSFTGASRDRTGRFELADGGTLFLDEVGEIPLVQQPKLLRVLQEGTFERVGEERTRRVDVRIIAASNRDLAREAQEGRFRSDLYYRLSVFPIEVPPLRERREDISLLAAEFVSRAAKEIGVPAPRFTQAHAREIVRYDWPGNIRELQHVVERAVILSRGGPLRFPDLANDAPRAPEAVAPSGPIPEVGGRDLSSALGDLKRREREILAAALDRSGGKISGPLGAAELLGLKPTTLDSKLKSLGLRAGSIVDPRRSDRAP